MGACKILLRSSLASPLFQIRSYRRPFSRRPLLQGYRPYASSLEGALSIDSACSHALSRNPDPKTPEKPNRAAVDELLTSTDDVGRLMKMEKKSRFVLPEKPRRWFPYHDRFTSEGADLSSEEALDPHMVEERFRNVVKNRSYSVCLVVEGLSDFGNISAAFRSADAFGIQSVHVVSYDNSKRYKDNRQVSMGAEKWLDIELWDSTKECFEVLKSRCYRIARHIWEQMRYLFMTWIGLAQLQ